MNETVNLHLPQFEASDRIHHDDFNDAFAAIDAAVPRIETGTYIGTGESGSAKPNTLTFDFVPKIIFITKETPTYTDYRTYLLHGCTAALVNEYLGSIINGITWNDAEHSVQWYSNARDSFGAEAQMNEDNVIYHYLAIG